MHAGVFLPNILVRDANNEKRASLLFLLDPSEGLALTSEDQEAILALDSATGRMGYDPGTQGW